MAFSHLQSAQIWRGCLHSRDFGWCPTGATLHSQGQEAAFVHPLLQLPDCHCRRLEVGEPLRAVSAAVEYRGPRGVPERASRGAAGVRGAGTAAAGGRRGPGAASAPAVHRASTWRGLVRVPASAAPDPAVAPPPLQGRRLGTHPEAVQASAVGQPHARRPRAACPQLPRRRPGRGHLLPPGAAAASPLPGLGAGSAVRRAAGGRRLARSPGPRRAAATGPAAVAPPRDRVRGQVVHGLDQQIIGLSQLGLQPARLLAAALRPRGGAGRRGSRGPPLCPRPLRLGLGRGLAAAGQVLVVVGAVLVRAAAPGARPGVQGGARGPAARGGSLLPASRPPSPDPRLARPRLRRPQELGPPRAQPGAARSLARGPGRRTPGVPLGSRSGRPEPEPPGGAGTPSPPEPGQRPPQRVRHALGLRGQARPRRRERSEPGPGAGGARRGGGGSP